MTKAQIQRIHQSWRLLKAIDPALVGDVFYSRLFFLHPKLRSLFPKEMGEQHQKLIEMLSYMVARLDQPEGLVQEIREMGQRHEGYGVKPEHYAMVGDALLWTLERGLGADWTPETAEAWGACYALIAGVMQE
jgi:hemoglobin-like flavoprotein